MESVKKVKWRGLSLEDYLEETILEIFQVLYKLDQKIKTACNY